MKLAFAAAACAGFLVLSTGAQAAQRYAAPEGKGGEPCVQGTPCSLTAALTKAKEGDEVIVTSGSYTVPETIFAEAKGLSIHGDLAGPMPTISASLPGYAVQVSGAGSVVSYLDLTDTGENAAPLFCIGGRVERVRVTGVGAGANGLIQSQGCTVRDSVLLATGTGAAALYTTGSSGITAVARNVTAIAVGSESVGIRVYNSDLFTSGAHVLDLKNSIVQGEKFDLLAMPGLEGVSEIVVSHSNFDPAKPEGSAKAKVTDAGGNQTAAPLFVDAAKSDYREAVGSPTIDTGVADQLGPLDLAGNARVQGPAPDIGAYETAGPTPPASELLSLALSPTRFRAANIGGAVISRKKRAPVGSTVFYKLSLPGTVDFTVERKSVGRRAGKKCVKQTAANKSHKKCPLYRPIRGGFSVTGTDPLNSFKFSGRVGGKSLKPGSYRLVGRSGTTLKRGLFRIVK